MWTIQPREIAGNDGKGTGRWRMTATYDDEGAWDVVSDQSHSHDTAEAAKACALCDAYISGATGLPPRARREKEMAELERLKGIYEHAGD